MNSMEYAENNWRMSTRSVVTETISRDLGEIVKISPVRAVELYEDITSHLHSRDKKFNLASFGEYLVHLQEDIAEGRVVERPKKEKMAYLMSLRADPLYRED